MAGLEEKLNWGKARDLSKPDGIDTSFIENKEEQKVEGVDTPKEEVETPEKKVEETQKQDTSTEEKVVEDKPQEKAEDKPQENEWENQKLELEKQLQEYKSKAEELESKKPDYDSLFANDELKSINEWLRNNPNENLDTFLKYRNLNLDKDINNKNEALDVVRLELKEGNPELDSKDIDRLVKKRYKALFDDSFETEDEEYQDALLDLKLEAKKAKNSLSEKKSKYQVQTVDPQQIEQHRQAQEQALNQFHSQVEESVRTYTEEPIKVGDIELKYNVERDEQKFIEHSIKNSQDFFNSYVEKGNDGNVTIDYPRLRKDLLKITAFDKAVKMAYDQGLSTGRKTTVDNLDNVDKDLRQKKSSPAKKSVMEQIIAGASKK